jgi:ribonucleotide monophosphatase NagD (HAD superfamily)
MLQSQERLTGKILILWASKQQKCEICNLRTCNLSEHHQDQIFGSAYAAAVYISSVIKLPKDQKVYVIGANGLEQELAEEGISFIGGTVSLSC